MYNFNYSRRKSSVVHIGNTPMGGDNPIRIQSMANVSTMDTEAVVKQAIRMIEAGAEYVRFTAQGEREARNLGVIRKELNRLAYDTPLIADIHFNPKAADVAAEEVEKVRINPGNYASNPETIRRRFTALLNICKQHGTALRIGVNHGSLSTRIMEQYGDTPEGMVASCMEFLKICREEHFEDVVISMKASNTVVMVKSVRLLVEMMDKEDMHYPLHLGVTEAGDGEDGRIKSAVGIGALLSDGIGDTIRVSLSEDPEAEIPVARCIVDHLQDTPEAEIFTAEEVLQGMVLVKDGMKHPRILHSTYHESDVNTFRIKAAMDCGGSLMDGKIDGLWLENTDSAISQEEITSCAFGILQATRTRISKTEYISCPSCGRTLYDLQTTITRIKVATSHLKGLKIGIMGCIVNGPGEMADADYGYVGSGRGKIDLYKGKTCIHKNIPEDEAVECLVQLIKDNGDWQD